MQNPTLTDSDCRKFLKAMKEFGYPNLTLKEVQDLAEKIGNGEDVGPNVIGMMMQRSIDDALEEKKAR